MLYKPGIFRPPVTFISRSAFCSASRMASLTAAIIRSAACHIVRVNRIRVDHKMHQFPFAVDHASTTAAGLCRNLLGFQFGLGFFHLFCIFCICFII